MTRSGKVLERRGDEVLVTLTGGEECSGCGARHSCHAITGGKPRERRTWMQNTVDASPGDLVELELAPSTSLTIISTTFLLPVLALAVGYMVTTGTDLSRALGAGIGLVVGILLAVLFNRRMLSRGRDYGLKIVRKMHEPPECGGEGGAESGTGGSDVR